MAAWRLVCIHQNEPSELSQWPNHNDSTINISIIILLLTVAQLVYNER